MKSLNNDVEEYYELLKNYNIEKIFVYFNINSVYDIEQKIKFFDIFSTRNGNYLKINDKVIPDTYREGDLHPKLKKLKEMCFTKLKHNSLFYDICKYIFYTRESIKPPTVQEIVPIQKSSSNSNMNIVPYLIMFFLFIFIMSLRKPFINF